MSTYLIGDVQGCYTELQQLLNVIDYDPKHDQLGFVGDLVNRGPDSLQVLRFLKNLTPSPWIVLGNHDFYALILGYGLVAPDAYTHQLHEFLNAPDRLELCDWLRQQDIVRAVNTDTTAVMVHAGIPPQWSVQQALSYAGEITQALRGTNFLSLLEGLFGNQPDTWHEALWGEERLRYCVNAFTRMRLCTALGRLDFQWDEANSNHPDLNAWFNWRSTKCPEKIYFGHWAKLQGNSQHRNCIALDTGCAWGHALTAIRVEDQQRFSVPATSGPSSR
jgi:bis(5'-nucleosyl)-tetraphosphatase (symmetrical)